MSKDEVKVARKTGIFEHESQFDECGSDTVPLEEREAMTASFLVGSFSAKVSLSYFGDVACYFGDTFSSFDLIGCEGDDQWRPAPGFDEV